MGSEVETGAQVAVTADPVAKAEPDKRSLPEHLRAIAGDLFAPKSSPSASASGSGRPIPKEVVSGLEERERLLGFVGSVVSLGSTVASYFIDVHTKLASVRAMSKELLILGLVLGVLMFLGSLLKRRALLGFASFMVGFDLISGDNRLGSLGILFLMFGGWLIMRVMRRQREQRATRSATARNTNASATTRAKAAPPAPKASKRYTPPRSAAGRRR